VLFRSNATQRHEQKIGLMVATIIRHSLHRSFFLFGFLIGE